jgi:TRAP transporter 4TM/12TM fusion protein
LDSKKTKFDFILSLLVLSTSIYLILFENALHVRNEVPVFFDLLFAGISIILALELTRRTTGLIIPILALFFLTYVIWWGQYVVGIFNFRGMNISRILYRMYFTDEGLFGMIASVSSTYVYMFILFAAFLIKSGAGDFIVKLAQNVTHKITGGPGLVAVLASGIMGTISGSAVANTVSTGSITISVMKKSGYSPRFAAAVEAASSTGGQLMPPIMGAGAFIMAQFTHIPYSTIIAAAFLPALLYFISIAFFVYIEAKKIGLKPISDSQRVPTYKLLKEGIHFLFPIGVLVFMLIYGFTPTYSAGVGIVAVIISSWFVKAKRMKVKDIFDALELGTRNMISTGILLITVGIIIGILNMTGISITFSQLVVQWSGSNLLLAILLTTIASLLLGMGLPVTAAYVMIAILVVPAFKLMGVSLLAAHMIIFWLSQDSNVTPPVCLAAFAASSISGSHPMRTGFTSWKLAKGLYILPLLFAYTNLIDGTWLERLTITAFSMVGFFAFTVVSEGFWFNPISKLLRLIVLFSSIGLFWPNNIFINFLGLVFFIIVGQINSKAKVTKEQFLH